MTVISESDRAQLSSLHFWIAFSGILIGALETSGAIPPGELAKLLTAFQTALMWAAYQMGYKATPVSQGSPVEK